MKEWICPVVKKKKKKNRSIVDWVWQVEEQKVEKKGVTSLIKVNPERDCFLPIPWALPAQNSHHLCLCYCNRCCSVAQSCPTLCKPMDYSMPSFPVLHHLPEVCSNSSIESVMPFNHLILCPSFLLLLSIFPSTRVFSNELALSIRWPNYWSFSFSTSPSNEHSGWFSLEFTGLISLLSKGLSRVFSNTTIQKHQFFSTQPSLWSHCTWLLEKSIALTNMGFPDSSVGKESACNTGDDS